ncbi:hypothetical protein KGM_204513 [Danaus plexippus plexippus]|uniref:Uncharacterized protein n=1 Tax=Danaus plexippus plexippus TaxID=278856 RepID=A0A212EIP1_DANPL|nr:hypothetical protein KGM_204513 [Danaus plexippus plexippus]
MCLPSEVKGMCAVMTILAETDWEKDVTVLRPIRNEICDLMNIKRPVMKQRQT